MRLTAATLLLLFSLAGLSGCQCCALTNHYACLVDRISDHEHTKERFYCAALDLNRIGRPDWCQCRVNRCLCGCACNRMRPVPCECAVCRETGVMGRDQVAHPDWSQPPVEEDGAEQSTADDEMSEDAPLPPALQNGDVPQFPGEERGERDLLLP